MTRATVTTLNKIDITTAYKTDISRLLTVRDYSSLRTILKMKISIFMQSFVLVFVPIHSATKLKDRFKSALVQNNQLRIASLEARNDAAN